MAFLTRRSFLASSAAAASFASAWPVLAADKLASLKIMTEDYPPFNYQQDGELRGLSVDLMLEMLKRAGASHAKSDIELLPWARGYNLTLNRDCHALFSTTRTEDREELFKWVGPFVPTIVGLTAKKSSRLKIKSAEELHKMRIGVVKDDVGHLLLKAAGLTDDKLDIVLYNDQNYKKLAAGRIDAVAYETNVTKFGLVSIGESLADYEVIHVLKRGDLYLALNKKTEDDIVRTLQAGFDSLVADGTYDRILASYFNQS